MSNPWITFVKNYAQKNNLSYLCAMCEITSDPNKKGYKKKVKPTKEQLREEFNNDVKNFANLYMKAVKNNDEEYINLIKNRYPRYGDKFKKALEKYPDVFDALDSRKSNELKQMKSQLDYLKDTYTYDYNKISDAVDNGVKLDKSIKKNFEKIYKQFEKLRTQYKEKGGVYKTKILSPQELNIL
jgi:hypothetical protein